MKHLRFGLVALLLGATAASAQPFPSGMADNFYASVLGGITAAPSLRVGAGKLGVFQGYNAGGRIGYKLDSMLPMSGFAVEADVFHTAFNYRNVSNSADIDSLSFMGNVVYHLDFDLPIPVGLYVGAGAGGVRDVFTAYTATGDRTVFGWQGIAGAEYEVAPGLTAFAEYRHQEAHNANIAGLAVGNHSENASVGFRVGL